MVAELLESILQGSHLVLTTSDLKKRSADWAEIFFGIIPEDRLRECYIAAEQNPDRRQEDRNFPLRRREILDAWYRIKAAEPKPIRDCDFCRMRKQSPDIYSECPFHLKPAYEETRAVSDAK